MSSKNDDPVRNHCRHVLAFEMQTGGSHPSYIRNFAVQWAEKIPDTKIDFLVTQEFAEQHEAVLNQVNSLEPGRIGMIVMKPDESHRVRVSNKFREFEGWKIFCDYAT